MAPTVPELGRFAEPALLILVSLSEGPKHGYAIMTDVEAGTGRPLGPGTLYAALARLEERGFIEALEPVDRRRPYRLTGLGSTVLAEQLRPAGGLREARTSPSRRRLGLISAPGIRRQTAGSVPPVGRRRRDGRAGGRGRRAARPASPTRTA